MDLSITYVLKYYFNVWTQESIASMYGPKYYFVVHTRVLLRHMNPGKYYFNVWAQESIAPTHGPKKVLLRRMESSIAEWAFTGSTCEYLRV